MFDRIMSRLGIYDVLGVLFAGVVISYSTKFTVDFLYGTDSFSLLRQPFYAFVVCYVVGLIFQEVTSVIYKTFMCKNKNCILKSALRPKKENGLLMETEEIEAVNHYITDKLGLETANEKENIIYNYCKNYFYKNSSTAMIDRDQAIAAMARSLSLYCLLMIVSPLYKIFVLVYENSASCRECLAAIAVSVGFAVLAPIFYNRFKRFTYRRFITIYRYFFYNAVKPEEALSASHEQKESKAQP